MARNLPSFGSRETAGANKTAAIDILSKATKQDNQVSTETYDYYQKIQAYVRNAGVPEEAFQGDLDILIEQGALKKPAPPASTFLDLSYLPK